MKKYVGERPGLSDAFVRPIAVRLRLEIQSTTAEHRDYSTRSLAFASAALCHCILSGESAPPCFSGAM
jgi:hypothetical protein